MPAQVPAEAAQRVRQRAVFCLRGDSCGGNGGLGCVVHAAHRDRAEGQAAATALGGQRARQGAPVAACAALHEVIEHGPRRSFASALDRPAVRCHTQRCGRGQIGDRQRRAALASHSGSTPNRPAALSYVAAAESAAWLCRRRPRLNPPREIASRAKSFAAHPLVFISPGATQARRTWPAQGNGKQRDHQAGSDRRHGPQLRCGTWFDSSQTFSRRRPRPFATS